MGDKVRTLRISEEASKLLDDNNKRHGDISYHTSNAIIAYFKKSPSPANEVVVSKKETKTKRFVKPSITEVSTYFYERGSLACQDSGQAFIDFYESKGWLVGKSPMKDWKAAVRNWMKNETKKTLNNGGTNGRKKSLSERTIESAAELHAFVRTGGLDQSSMGENGSVIPQQMDFDGGRTINHEPQRSEGDESEFHLVVQEDGIISP